MRWSPLAIAGFIIALGAAVALFLGGFGYNRGWWSIRDGFTVVKWGAYAGLAAVAVSLAGCFTATAPRRGLTLAAAGLVIGVLVAATAATERDLGRGVPSIHDITTDTTNPPQFVAAVAARAAAGARNPPEYDNVAAQQRAAFPDIAPLVLNVSADQAFDRALAAARAMGWDILAAEKSQGRIEATATTRWFRFKDDVVIRVRPEGAGARIDVRSKSRIGQSDLGANARRVRAYIALLRQSS
jgi:uncharacterized protein (DUF1499 family)